MSAPDWPGTVVVDPSGPSGLSGEIGALKQAVPGELQVHGSARLAATLHGLGLVDIYRIIVAPVVLGRGKRLFPEGAAPSGFDVRRSHQSSRGLTYLEFVPKVLERAEAVVADGRDSVR